MEKDFEGSVREWVVRFRLKNGPGLMPAPCASPLPFVLAAEAWGLLVGFRHQAGGVQARLMVVHDDRPDISARDIRWQPSRLIATH